MVVTPTKIVIPNILDWYMRDSEKMCGVFAWFGGNQIPSVALGKSMAKCVAHDHSKQGKNFSNVIQVMAYDINEVSFCHVTPYLGELKACIKEGLHDSYGDEVISAISHTFLQCNLSLHEHDILLTLPCLTLFPKEKWYIYQYHICIHMADIP